MLPVTLLHRLRGGNKPRNLILHLQPDASILVRACLRVCIQWMALVQANVRALISDTALVGSVDNHRRPFRVASQGLITAETGGVCVRTTGQENLLMAVPR